MNMKNNKNGKKLSLSNEKIERNQQSDTELMVENRHYSNVTISPFPVPEVLSKYKDIDENLVERIFQFTESNSQHIRDIQQKQVNNETLAIKNQTLAINNIHKENLIKIIGSLIVPFSCMGMAFLSANFGYEVLSYIFGSASGLGIVSTIYNSIKLFLKNGNDNNIK